MIRVAIFNDSATVRARLKACLTESSGFEVVLEATDGRAARQRVEEARADLVLMDVIMPHVDGYEATREIIAGYPVAIVIVTAALDPKDSAVIFRALSVGALYVTGPPKLGDVKQTAAFMQLLRAMVGAKPKSSASEPAGPRAEASAAVASRWLPVPPSRISVIGIAGSAGGPQALGEVLRGLNRRGLPPIVIVQHMASHFHESFASWLESTTGHRVVLATREQQAEPGTVYLAGGNTHLEWTTESLILAKGEPVSGFRPSATVLFRSLAKEGDRAVVIVLSGMGEDGADGAAALHAAGGHVIIQSRSSAPVWGMPGEVARRGVADSELPTHEIAPHVLAHCGFTDLSREP